MNDTTSGSPSWGPYCKLTRRDWLGTATAMATLGTAAGSAMAQPAPGAPLPVIDPPPQMLAVELQVNGQRRNLTIDSRTTLLDALRENLQMGGTKKGCDHGQCGACTVLVDGRRINACLTLAAMHDGQAVTTIEGLARGTRLHPVQAAFIKHDGFQCGYCTPGQICSTVGMLQEVRMGMPSHVTPDLRQAAKLTDAEIRERMSGNICRCSAYPNIVASIQEAAKEGA